MKLLFDAKEYFIHLFIFLL